MSDLQSFYQDDNYGLVAFIDDNIKRIFLNNPSVCNFDEEAALLVADDNCVVGRQLLYPTRIKEKDTTFRAQSFGSIEVHNSQRGNGIGTLISDYALNDTYYPFFIGSLLSPECLSIMKKKKNCILFDFPEYKYILNTKTAFALRGLKGPLLKISAVLGDALNNIIHIVGEKRYSVLNQKYNIKKELIVPCWAEKMCLDDEHKYAEVHDTAWLQWNLDNNLSGSEEDVQSFFSIYDNDTPIGFFFTKERVLPSSGVPIVIGALVEWASIDTNLTEADINVLAAKTFSKRCYYFRTVTDDKITKNELKKYGFLHNGSMQMVIKDKYNKCPDMNIQSNWRLRFGCCNSILF